MALVFTGIIPSNLKCVEELSEQMVELEGDLYCMKPDVVVAISDVGYEDGAEAIDINIASPVHGENADEKVSVDIAFSSRLKDKVANYGDATSMTVVAESTVPSELFTPVHKMMEHLEDAKVVFISTSKADLATHKAFGEQLHHVCMETNSRVAILNVGHFSTGKKKDALGEVLLRKMSAQELDKIDTVNDEVLHNSTGTLARPLAITAGALQKMKTNPRIIAETSCSDAHSILLNFGVI